MLLTHAYAYDHQPDADDEPTQVGVVPVYRDDATLPSIPVITDVDERPRPTFAPPARVDRFRERVALASLLAAGLAVFTVAAVGAVLLVLDTTPARPPIVLGTQAPSAPSSLPLNAAPPPAVVPAVSTTRASVHTRTRTRSTTVDRTAVPRSSVTPTSTMVTPTPSPVEPTGMVVHHVVEEHEEPVRTTENTPEPSRTPDPPAPSSTSAPTSSTPSTTPSAPESSTTQQP